MGGAPSTLLQEPALMLGGADVLEDGGDGFFATHGIGAVLSVCDKRPAEREGLHLGRRVVPHAGAVAPAEDADAGVGGERHMLGRGASDDDVAAVSSRCVQNSPSTRKSWIA